MALSIEREIGHTVQQRMAKLAERLPPVRWVPPDKMHLTLAFLGDVDERDIPAVCHAVEKSVRTHAPINIHVHGVGAFPNFRRPHTIWVGMSVGKTETIALHESVAASLERIGFPRERRPFSPHITIGRHKPNGRVSAGFTALESLTNWTVGNTVIESVEVMSSQLSRDHGATYAVLSRHPLVDAASS